MQVLLSHKKAQKLSHEKLKILFVPFCGSKNVRTRTCSPLHIRALTRPLIFQCVTEPLIERLVASIPVSISKFVGVKRCSASTRDSANNRALLAADQSAKHRSCAHAAGRGQFVAMTIPERPVSIPVVVTITSLSVNLISVTRISNALFVPIIGIGSPIPRLCSDRNGGDAQSQQTNNT